jgi:hypothetical protein
MPVKAVDYNNHDFLRYQIVKQIIMFLRLGGYKGNPVAGA